MSKLSALERALDTQHLHPGHDYRRADRGPDGSLRAVYGLGASEVVVKRLLRLLPEYEAVEKSRKPGVGDPSDWLRVDLILRAEV